MSLAISQLSCFSSMVYTRRLQLHTRSYPCPTKFRSGKVFNVMSSDGNGTKVSHLENKANGSCIEDPSSSNNGNSVQSDPVLAGSVAGGATNGDVEERAVSETKRAAKIHDFCFGIPFGGVVLGGGLVSCIVSRSLGYGVVFGGALLALSTLSLKVWRQGQSSLPFILGQAVIAVALLWKNLQAYASTKKLFPTAFNIAISGAMLCFYSYVVISGGNPPPKKLKHSTSS